MTHRATPAAGPLFRADWLNAVFLHLRVDADLLQRAVPLGLDRFDGDAYVSLVAFTQAIAACGRRAMAGMAQCAAGATRISEFANLRLSRRRARHLFSRRVDSQLSGLAHRSANVWVAISIGRIDLRQRHSGSGNDWPSRRRERIASLSRGSGVARVAVVASPDSLDAFLLERYTAFTCRNHVIRRFEVTHEPWKAIRLDATLVESDLPGSAGEWWGSAQLVAAHFSAGVCDVGISAPARVAHMPRRPSSSKSPLVRRRSPGARECRSR